MEEQIITNSPFVHVRASRRVHSLTMIAFSVTLATPPVKLSTVASAVTLMFSLPSSPTVPSLDPPGGPAKGPT